MVFSEALINTRNTRGLSQYHFAKTLGISKRTLSRWENGDGYPHDLNVIYLLWKLYEINIYELEIKQKK